MQVNPGDHVLDHDTGAGVAAGVRPAGSGVSHDVCAGRVGAVRLVVPAGGCAVGRRAGGAAAGVGDGVGLLPADRRSDGADPHGGGSVGRDVVGAGRLGGVAEGVGV